MSLKISPALGPGDIEEIRLLFIEYAGSLGFDLSFQKIAPYYDNPIIGVRYYELDLGGL